VILDARLTWREHVDAKVRKVRNMMWADRTACGGRRGLRPRVVYWLYVFVVKASITYASMVWWAGCATVKYNPKACMPRDHGSDAYYTHQCGGGIYRSPSAGFGDTG
jgi:hypothetical protein